MRTPDPSLTPEQVAEVERIYQAFRDAAEDEQWRIARLLASNRDHELLAESEVLAPEWLGRGVGHGDGGGRGFADPPTDRAGVDPQAGGGHGW